MERSKSKSASDKAVPESAGTFSRIKPEQRQSTTSISFIWMGSVVCIPVLALGATLIGQVPLVTLVLFAVLGFLVQSVLVTLNGIAGADQGLPLAILMANGFGEQGSRFVGSLIIAINVTGNFALQTTFCSSAFVALLQTVWGIQFPFWLAAVLWGGIMTVTAITGFGGMKWLNYVAMPLLALVSVYGTVVSLVKYGGIGAVAAYQPAQMGDSMSVLSVLIGLIAGASVICADITRYAKSRKAVVVSTATGFFPTAVVFIAFGAIMGLGSGTGDISAVFVNLGMPFIGLIAMILATWTTNVTNGYSAGLAITRFMGLPESKLWLSTLLAGVVGILLSVAGMNITDFFGFMGTITPPIAGVMVADYWIIGRGNRENWGIRKGFSWPAIAATVAGAAIGLLYPNFLNPSINSIVVSLVAFVVLFKIGERTGTIPQRERFD